MKRSSAKLDDIIQIILSTFSVLVATSKIMVGPGRFCTRKIGEPRNSRCKANRTAGT